MADVPTGSCAEKFRGVASRSWGSAMMNAEHPMDKAFHLPTALSVRTSRAHGEGIVWKDLFNLAKVLSNWIKPVHCVLYLTTNLGCLPRGLNSYLGCFPFSSRVIQISAYKQNEPGADSLTLRSTGRIWPCPYH